MDLMNTVNIFWFRRDLRLHDNAALYHALKDENPVIPIFIFDKNILDKIENVEDRRLIFIYDALKDIQKKIEQRSSSLEVYYDFPENVFTNLLSKYTIVKVYTNHDYEPYAIDRDEKIRLILQSSGATLITYKDQVIFEKDEVTKDDGKPYTVFTPYSKKWKAKLNNFYLRSYTTENFFSKFYKQKSFPIPSLESMGFKYFETAFPSKLTNETLIKNYYEQRNFPFVNGTSKLGVHLRFGTISIRELASTAKELNETFLNELIWRDFYQSILWHFPHVGFYKAFKPEYENIEWRNNEKEFALWCKGETGYPIVDAGMRELNQTGFMHNRVRMIVASFLSKHLLIDWRWGEAYFAERLLDYDLAANNGGWQWAAGSGCDAAPYFRIFNPYLQTKKFDPKLKYIKKWVPEFQEFSYPAPIVEHEFARKRCLEIYSKALKK
jgi:deoxyribodipyrimidine photo-lyase